MLPGWWEGDWRRNALTSLLLGIPDLDEPVETLGPINEVNYLRSEPVGRGWLGALIESRWWAARSRETASSQRS